jgi:putative ATP-dependent endonuclease of OLD family
MKLDSISIKRYRSIEFAELNSCGGFNVLIGKNNSGKSNVLSAISAFFGCLADNNIATLNPPIGQEIDFFERDIKQPIQIAIIFSMTLAERDALIRDIVTEAPQMKNAVDGIDPALRLLATVSIVPPPNGFGFVNHIALVGAERATQSNPERVLFDVSLDAAKEVYDKLTRTHDRFEEADAYSNLLPQIKRYASQIFGPKAEGESPAPLRYLLDFPLSRVGSVANPDLLREVETLVKQSSSFEEFSRTVQALMTRMREEATRLQGEPLRNKVVTFSGEQSIIPLYVKNLLSRISSSKLLYLRERRKQIGKDEAARLLSLKVTRGGPQVLHNIQETVSALLGVQIDAFESEATPRRDSSRREPNAEMHVDNFLADVNGSGVREALRIVLDFEFEHPNVLLIEEPEIYLYSSLETSMMRYLKRVSSICQVFIATHSTNFLDTGEMKNVYLVSKTKSTQVQLLDYEEAETQIPRELGIRLSSLFMFDRLVFVEGPSDEAVFREWASTLRVNFSQHNVGFVHMGGVRNFTHYAAEATLSFLAKRRVQMWFIIDHDERSEEEIAKLRAIAGKDATVNVLERRELENYLISPGAISKFIALKRNLSGVRSSDGPPSESDISEMIDQCAEKLKQTAVDRQSTRILCIPAYPNLKGIFDEKPEGTIADRVANELQRLITQLEQTKAKIASVYAEQTERVANAWSSEKLNLVPGDTLLDLVSQGYGCRFKKEQDSPRLARLMTEAEIPREIQLIIREIDT